MQFVFCFEVHRAASNQYYDNSFVHEVWIQVVGRVTKNEESINIECFLQAHYNRKMKTKKHTNTHKHVLEIARVYTYINKKIIFTGI